MTVTGGGGLTPDGQKSVVESSYRNILLNNSGEETHKIQIKNLFSLKISVKVEKKKLVKTRNLRWLWLKLQHFIHVIH